MRKKALGLFCVLLTAAAVLLTGCASVGAKAETNLFTIPVVNKSYFDIELLDDTRVVPARGERALTLPRYAGELDDGYSLTYRVNLLDGVHIKIRRDENVVVHPAQEMLVIENAAFTASETFVVLHNESLHTVKVRYEEGYRDGLKDAGSGRRQYGSANIAAGDSALFDRIPPRITLSVESDNYRATPFPSMAYRPGYRYVYAFDGAAVALVDARPLHAIGEPSTVKTLTALPDPVDEAVAAAIPRPKAYAYRVINALLPRDNGAVLAVGGADERGGFGRTERAWLCEAEAGGGGGYSVRWELVPEDLEAGLGPARSVCYDAKRGVYRVLGEYAADDAWGGTAPASYVLDVDETGKPAGPALVLPNAVLTRIIGDAAGGAYLAGEAVEAGRSAALLVKLSGEGVVWQKQAALPRNSYYQDALFDEDENQIVVAGVQNGETGAGEGGAPFIRGVNAETGEAVWHSELTAAPFSGTALVWRIEKTASGCRIVLCGIAGGVPAPPYLEASVNARGRFIEQ